MSFAWAPIDGGLALSGTLPAGALVQGAPGDLAITALSLRAPLGGWVTVEMSLLDVEDGVSMAELTSALRRLRDAVRAAGGGGLRLVEAPQHLAHTLYKVGDLRDGSLLLVDPRSDEGRWGP